MLKSIQKWLHKFFLKKYGFVDYIEIFFYMWQYFWPHAVSTIKPKIYGGHTSNTIQLFPNYLSSVKCFETVFSQVTLGYHYHLWQVVLVVLIETFDTVLLCICLEFNFKFFHLKWKLQQCKHFLSTNQGFFWLIIAHRVIN